MADPSGVRLPLPPEPTALGLWYGRTAASIGRQSGPRRRDATVFRAGLPRASRKIENRWAPANMARQTGANASRIAHRTVFASSDPSLAAGGSSRGALAQYASSA